MCRNIQRRSVGPGNLSQPNFPTFPFLQDIGVATLVKRVAPSLPIHASTQMSITSADGADFARQLGAKRVVVGRELSVADISKVSAGTDAEVEAFVHGALCVSYRCGSPFR